MTVENNLMHAIQLEATRLGARLLRNNAGAFQDKTGRWVFYGLGHVAKGVGDGSSDLIGYRPITITEAHLGRVIGQIIACEVKRPGKIPSKDQHQFLEAVARGGGLAFWCDSIEQVRDRLSR